MKFVQTFTVKFFKILVTNQFLKLIVFESATLIWTSNWQPSEIQNGRTFRQARKELSLCSNIVIHYFQLQDFLCSWEMRKLALILQKQERNVGTTEKVRNNCLSFYENLFWRVCHIDSKFLQRFVNLHDAATLKTENFSNKASPTNVHIFSRKQIVSTQCHVWVIERFKIS